MSEEEKAIKKMKRILYMFPESKEIKLLLNLIENQQKEITKLSEKVTNNICANVENEVLEEYRQKIEKQQKEIEEKTTILLAGAEKVKQLEKEIEEMREELQMYVDVQNNDIHNYISKDKIREKIKELEETILYFDYDEIQILKDLLEEN